MTKNGYKVFTLRLARELCNLGYKIIATMPNAKKPWLNVFVFEDSEDFRKDLKRLLER
jgi:hypothetical protein